MQKYESLARELLQAVGGEANVQQVTHCLTRLRFTLKDDQLVDKPYLEQHPDALALVQGGGQFQIVIGHHVADVYASLLEFSKLNQSDGSKSDSGSLWNNFMGIVSGVFQPSMGVLVATSMIKGLVAVLSFCGFTAENSGLYVLLEATGDGFSQFLPIVLAINATSYFQVHLFTGVALAAALLYPNLNLAQELPTFFGFPISLPMGGYYQTVLPIIIAVWLASKVEKWLKKVVPDMVKFFLVPLLTLLTTAPLTLLLLGPISVTLSNWVGDFFQALYHLSPILLGLILGGLWQVLVLFGLHWGLIPIITIQMETKGFSPLLAIITFVSFSQLGTVLAIILKTKDKHKRRMGYPMALSALFGVTEPAIYGLSLPLRFPFLASNLGGAIQGAYIGWTATHSFTMGGLGIFALANFIDPRGRDLTNLIQAITAMLLATASGFLLTYLAKFPDSSEVTEEKQNEQSLHSSVYIMSPLTGKVVPLEEMSDPVFASGTFGKGIAIQPEQGVLFSPIQGQVTSLFPTQHAIGLLSDDGAEVLIHIGVDTVQSQGEGFTALVSVGDSVEPGQALIQFNQEELERKGFDLTTAVVLTNSEAYLDILRTNTDETIPGEVILTAIKTTHL
ncbi:beta-glucoside-specific PTS transporter subunit IIABC [Streptococcus ovuberis]|uniref:PTS system sucrose-specific EIIBCA component n=1 Tax=Streptococcus ovuberis TaxID=1936207 RepID=A0A7X6S2A8_9STRE|nr:beta-glucoside-specific PTS transporter subunit IIABC [Streptococcus ovuberis]NKZ21200.1 PTS transporter subunit EIIC [Streptococcus ovuberis]